jgi:hypothetical protein
MGLLLLCQRTLWDSEGRFELSLGAKMYTEKGRKTRVRDIKIMFLDREGCGRLDISRQHF